MSGPEQGARNLPRLCGAWLERRETQAVFAAIAGAGHEARAVGGAVRNALIGEPVRDVDIATTATPETVMKLAQLGGLKAIATGLQHGTVTLISNHIPFEVTTLRRDVETYGRHAKVDFTDNWIEDARRRDFTINALYCAADGTVHDPLGGYDDILARRVRFIGEARERISEDYLRILRFFRFTAEYANGAVEAHGLAAVTTMAPGLDGLSRERVRAELLRILSAPGAVAVLAIMNETAILGRVLVTQADVPTFARLCTIEETLSISAEPILRLAALAVHRPGDALHLRDGLRLSSSEYERLALLALPEYVFDPAAPERDAKAYIYRHGAGAFRDGALLAWARSGEGARDAARLSRATLTKRWQAPQCPVRGADILALGVPAGPLVGQIMSAFEEWWMQEDFTLDAAHIHDELQRLAMVTKT